MLTLKHLLIDHINLKKDSILMNSSIFLIKSTIFGNISKQNICLNWDYCIKPIPPKRRYWSIQAILFELIIIHLANHTHLGKWSKFHIIRNMKEDDLYRSISYMISLDLWMSSNLWSNTRIKVYLKTQFLRLGKGNWELHMAPGSERILNNNSINRYITYCPTPQGRWKEIRIWL